MEGDLGVRKNMEKEHIKSINEILYCNRCDQESPCIWLNSESVAFNAVCPNGAEWRPLPFDDDRTLSQLRRALNDLFLIGGAP